MTATLYLAKLGCAQNLGVLGCALSLTITINQRMLNLIIQQVFKCL